MPTLEILFSALAKKKNARWWVGDRPDVREEQISRAIAAQVGYPTSTQNPFDYGGIIPVSWQQAAHVLAVAGTTDLVYGHSSPKSQHVKDALAALQNLSGKASFFSNGLWPDESTVGWSPLTSATFDCGVIGYDNRTAFIFWVEEED